MTNSNVIPDNVSASFVKVNKNEKIRSILINKYKLFQKNPDTTVKTKIKRENPLQDRLKRIETKFFESK